MNPQKNVWTIGRHYPEDDHTLITYTYQPRNSDYPPVWDTVLLKGRISETQLRELSGCMSDDGMFIPGEVGMKDLQPMSCKRWRWADEHDHAMHQITEVSYARAGKNSTVPMNVAEFMKKLSAMKNHWDGDRYVAENRDWLSGKLPKSATESPINHSALKTSADVQTPKRDRIMTPGYGERKPMSLREMMQQSMPKSGDTPPSASVTEQPEQKAPVGRQMETLSARLARMRQAAQPGGEQKQSIENDARPAGLAM